MYFLDTPIEYLKGVGPIRAELLKKEINIFTFSDLLHYYPFRYTDRSVIHKVAELNAGMPYIQLKGKIVRFEEIVIKHFSFISVCKITQNCYDYFSFTNILCKSHSPTNVYT